MIGVALYEQDQQRVKALQERRRLNRDQGKSPTKDPSNFDAEDGIYGKPTYNQFYSGQYMVWNIKWIYEVGNKTVRQQLDLARREWPSRI